MDTSLEPRSIDAMKAEIDGTLAQFQADEISLEELTTYIRTRFDSAVKDVRLIPEEGFMIGGMPALLRNALVNSIVSQSVAVQHGDQMDLWWATTEALELSAKQLPYPFPSLDQLFYLIYLLIDGQMTRIIEGHP